MSTAVLANPANSAPRPLMTAAEFMAKHDGDCVELVRGQVVGLVIDELKEPPMASIKHGRICMLIVRLMDEFADRQNLGRVMSNDSFVQTRFNPDTIRGADLCYYSFERLPKGEIPEGLLQVQPELVVEVRSPSNTWSEVFTKIAEYLAAGVKVAILVDPPSCSASVYRADELQQIFHNGDELVVPDILPGFTVQVRSLFE